VGLVAADIGDETCPAATGFEPTSAGLATSHRDCGSGVPR